MKTATIPVSSVLILVKRFNQCKGESEQIKNELRAKQNK